MSTMKCVGIVAPQKYLILSNFSEEKNRFDRFLTGLTFRKKDYVFTIYLVYP
jgi:hypothetical protein